MNRIVCTLREMGYRLTPQRRAVIDALSECGGFTDASVIFGKVRLTNEHISLDTIYRNLKLLIELGVVNQINNPRSDRTLYELITDSPHQHAVCLACGKIECIDHCTEMVDNMVRLASDGFKVVNHSFEAYGYCAECQKKQLREDKNDSGI
ncbi:Fur family transcriptional regulator [Sporomusa aerivorans]|uniref:Fur family transcriptional regulator n=1 Tax=Sporomusa aerivorans TaxID=204936 RepID=UPI00352B151D